MSAIAGAASSSSSGTGPSPSGIGVGRAAAKQYAADTRILASFDSGRPFDYLAQSLLPPAAVTAASFSAYLAKLQRGGLVQPFGCLLAVRPSTLSLLAYSANAPSLLGFPLDSPSLLSTDARHLFTPATSASLADAVASHDLALANPVYVQSRFNNRVFYGILHRVDVGLVIDLEPASRPSGGGCGRGRGGALPAHKLVARAIARLQSLPGGDVGALCDAVVEHVQELTGYDRVMVYKFHEDEHGEVVSEIRRSDLEPYLGLHYPATDVPQATRALFKQNRVRIIVDRGSELVPIIQDQQRLDQPLCLASSTLRAPHPCHVQYMANMGITASLVMAVLVNNGGGSTRLWGLVVCHHTVPRYVPLMVRYACEFLMQAFGLQVNLELQLLSQLAEKKILKTQTLLCDMLLRDSLLGIVNQSPNIMDLVKCDGAALYYNGKCYRLGVTPTEEQISDIVKWLLDCHGDSTGLTTESLVEAGYPGADGLSDVICGMAATRIVSKDFLFWFRCQTAKTIKWGGEKQKAESGDDGGRMNPRLSFKVFLEVVNNRSLPWEASEINAIHSLQLIIRDSYRDVRDSSDKMICTDDVEMEGMDELSVVACEMVRLIETARVPVIAVDVAGLINGWNARAGELMGLSAEEALGKSLVHEIVHEDSRELVGNHLSRALRGFEDKNIELKLRTFGLQQKNTPIVLKANACSSKDCNNGVVGVCFVGEDVTGVKTVTDKFIRLLGDYKTIVQSINPSIPPLFASDENIRCSEWNTAMERLTGWTREEAIGKLLIGEIFGGFCQLKGDDALTKFMMLLYGAIGGKDIEKTLFAFLDKKGNHVETVLTANRRTDMDGNIIGCFCFLQPATSDLQQALNVERQQERKWLTRLKELAYIRQEIKNPLNGMLYTHKLLESTTSSNEQRQFLETSAACERQLMNIVKDMDLESIENGRMELDLAWFILGNVMDAVFSQVMLTLSKKNLELIRKIPEEIKTIYLYGDQSRLQQVLADILLYLVNHAPFQDSWVEIEVLPNLKQEDEIKFAHLEFRMTHPGQGIPSEHVQDMFYGNTSTEEGLGLNISRRLLKSMNGSIQYIREPTKSYFLINIEIQTTKK